MVILQAHFTDIKFASDFQCITYDAINVLSVVDGPCNTWNGTSCLLKNTWRFIKNGVIVFNNKKG